MKKIAILTCLHSNDVCTRTGCLEALKHKTGTFDSYRHEAIELAAVWTCQGCGNMKFSNKGDLQEKLSAITAAEITAVHIGKCCWRKTRSGRNKKCRYVEQIEKWLLMRHIQVIWGTHA